METLAQLGVSLLLFGLGMELSPTRLRATWGVAVVGGALQVGLAMALGAVTSSVLLGASASAGAFVGSLLAMSSTSIVVKCLEATRCVWGGHVVCCGSLLTSSLQHLLWHAAAVLLTVGAAGGGRDDSGRWRRAVRQGFGGRCCGGVVEDDGKGGLYMGWVDAGMVGLLAQRRGGCTLYQVMARHLALMLRVVAGGCYGMCHTHTASMLRPC